MHKTPKAGLFNNTSKKPDARDTIMNATSNELQRTYTNRVSLSTVIYFVFTVFSNIFNHWIFVVMPI